MGVHDAEGDGEVKPNPKLVDGKLVCSNTECEMCLHGSLPEYDQCEPTRISCGTLSDDPPECWPAIREQRDEATATVNRESEAIGAAGFQNVHEIIKELKIRTGERDALQVELLAMKSVVAVQQQLADAKAELPTTPKTCTKPDPKVE